MAVIVDLVIPQAQVDACCGAFLECGESQNLVVASKSLLRVFRFSPQEKPFLHLVTSSSLKDDISAVIPVPKSSGNGSIAVLTSSKVVYLHLANSVLVPDEHIGHFDSVGVDVNQSLVPLPTIGTFAGTDELNALFCYRIPGCLSLINPHIGIYETLPIGNITVCRIVPLTRSNHLAVLYRDFEFRYSLRYYRINMSSDRCTLDYQQFEDFKEAPSLLVPLPSGGVMVVSDLCIYVFPAPAQRASLADTLVDSPNFRVSQARNVVTLFMTHAPYLGSSFSAFTAIDEKRFLITSDSGQSLIVFLDTEWTGSTLTVLDFRILDLQRTTPSDFLVHIQGNVFFASSKTSRSILFRILPQSPHINILAYFPASSPILDLDYKYSFGPDAHSPMLLVSQGGFYGGELRRYLQPLKIVESIVSSHLHGLGHNRLHLMSKLDNVFTYASTSSSNEILSVFTVDLRTDRTDKIRTLNSQDWHNGISYLQESLAKKDFNVTLDNGTSVYISQEALVVAGDSHHEYQLEGHASSLSHGVVGGKTLIFVTLFDGSNNLFELNKNGLFLLLSPELPADCFAVSSVILSSIKGLLLLVLVDQEGALWQFLCLNGEVKNSVNLRPQIASIPSLSFELGTALFYDKRSVSLLERDEEAPFAQLKEISTFPNTCCHSVAVDDEHALVLFSDGGIELIKYGNHERCMEAHFSDQLILKSKYVPGTKYILRIEADVSVNRRTRRFEKKCFLSLIREDTLEVVDTYGKAEHEPSYTDFHFLPEDDDLQLGQHYFVVANSDKSWDKMLPIFRIKKGKIVHVANPTVHGSFPEAMSVQKLVYDGTLHVIGSDYVACYLEFSDEYQWRSYGCDRQFGFSTFGVDAAPLFGDLIAIGDASNGIVVTDGKQRIEKLRMLTDYNFITAISAQSSTDDAFLIVADSFGNVSGSTIVDQEGRIKETDHVFIVNVKDQVNVILPIREDATVYVGTVSGGIYRISYDEDISIEGDAYNELTKQAIKFGHESRFDPTREVSEEEKDMEVVVPIPNQTVYDGRILRHWRTMNSGQKRKLKNCWAQRYKLDSIAYKLATFAPKETL